MADLKRIEKALRNAHAAGDTAAATKLAEAYRSAQSQAASEEDGYRGTSVDRFARGVGSGLASVAGAPFDLMNAGLGLIGQDVERPWLGSENIREAMGKVGLAPEEGVDPEARETLAGTLGSGLGNALGILTPMGVAARTANLGAGAARAATPSTSSNAQRAVDSLLGDVARRPGVFAAAESGGNMGAAAGGYLARDQDETTSVMSQLAGGLAGSLTPVGAAAGGRATLSALDATMIPTLVRGAGDRIFSTTNPGQYTNRTMDQAARVVQGQAADLPAARSATANVGESLSGLSPAVQSRDAGLMALENRVQGATPASQLAQRTSQERALESAERAFTGLGDNVPVSRAGEELVRRRQDFAQSMDRRIQRAQERAVTASRNLGEARGRGTVSTEFNEEIAKAYRESSQEVQRVWDKVDKKLPASARNTLGAVNRAVDDIGEAGRVFGGDIPGPLRRLMSQAPEGQAPVTNVGELQNLRRILGERASAFGSGANPDRYRAKLMNDIIRAIDDDFATVGELSPGRLDSSVPVSEAIAATRQLSQRFRQDGIAQALARSSTGGDRVQAEQVLERLLPIGSQGSSTAGMAGARQIERAITESMGPVTGMRLPKNSNAPVIQRGVEEYLTGEFQRRAASTGRLEPAKAEKFLRDNRETLSLPQFSDLQVRLRNATDAAARGDASQARMAQIMDRANDPRQSRAAMFLGTDTADGTYQNAIANITRGDASANMREIIRQVRRDPTGEARKGLKTGFTRYALAELRGPGGLPDGDRMMRIFSEGSTEGLPAGDAALSRAAKELFSGAELRQLRESADVFRLLGQSRSAGATPDSVHLGADGLSRLAEIGSQVMGANIGARLGSGGASIQAANIGSNAIRDLAKRIAASPVDAAIADAINDPKLFRALLDQYPRSKVKLADTAGRVIGSWLVQLPQEEGADAQ